MATKETVVGNIPDNWKIERIIDLAKVVTDFVANGSFASLAQNVNYKRNPDYAVLIRLTDYNNDFKDGFVYIDKHAYDFLSKSKLTGGEIIISNVGANVGTVFKCPYLDKPMSLAPNAIMVKFKGYDDFYYYWFKSNNGQQQLKSIVTGSAQPKFNKTNFKELFLPVPPLAVQKKIAALLTIIDNKIELNKKMNLKLEEQALALFTNCIKYKEHTGKLIDIVNENKKSKIQVGAARGIKGKYPFYTSGQAILEYNEALVDDRNIFLNTGGNADVKFYIGEAAYSTDTWCINGGLYTDFIYLYLLSIINEINLNYFEGSALKHLQKKKLLDRALYIPPKNEILSFNNLVVPIMEKVISNKKENMKLSELRDTLLPRLMSGEIDLEDIDI